MQLKALIAAGLVPAAIVCGLPVEKRSDPCMYNILFIVFKCLLMAIYSPRSPGLLLRRPYDETLTLNLIEHR